MRGWAQDSRWPLEGNHPAHLFGGRVVRFSELERAIPAFSGPEGHKTLAGDLEMAPGQEGAKPSGKGVVVHPVFAAKGNYSPRLQKGCEVKR